MGKITPCLWFDGKAEEAARFYISVFRNARITGMMHYGEAGPGPAGSVLSVTFELEGQDFIALNGGPHFTFSPAISFFTKCETQEDVDDLWEKLSAGGEKNVCGWLRDQFGVSWQIVPTILGDMLRDKDSSKANRVMRAMLQMQKLDIAELKRAYAQD